jgi:opacity protein-like surface antigen
MRKLSILKILYSLTSGILLVCVPLFAQDYNRDLSFEGIDQVTSHSAAARGAGNISIGAKNDIGLMFQNPSSLVSIESMQISLGVAHSSRSSSQQQEYAPVRYYSNLSLLLEGLTDIIPNPPHDSSIFAPFGNTAMDTVQRPYDSIGPDWSNSKKNSLPIQVMLALPVLSSENYKIVAGVGAVEYANLDHYYQNNNVLTPSILSQRPLPVFRPADDNPLDVQWLQQVRQRKGSVQGYGFALAGSMQEYNLSFGFSGMFLNGSTDDFEQEIGRGSLTFYANAFRADSLYRRVSRSGTSDFSGQEYTLSSTLTGKYVSLGFSVKLPTTITRKFSSTISMDTSGTAQTSNIKGEDELQLGWRGVVGLSLTPKENIRLAIEYDFRPFESVRYMAADGAESKPWLPVSLFRIGMEYTAAPWLTIRGGMRGDAKVFQPEGNQIEDEPVSYTVYSAGLGVYYSGMNFNLAYEYSQIKYQDVWASEISKNKERNYVLVADLSYEIPWGF